MVNKDVYKYGGPKPHLFNTLHILYMIMTYRKAIHVLNCSVLCLQ